MTFKREVDKKQILGAFKEGFENNSRADLAKLLPGLAQRRRRHEGPQGRATCWRSPTCPARAPPSPRPGGVTATVEGKVFADALLRNWLGEKPADGDLKSGMLGK